MFLLLILTTKILYSRPCAQASTINNNTACWKGFEDYSDACNAWHDWVRDGTLPESLRFRYRHNPPVRPTHDDMAIAGRHRHGQPATHTAPAVTVHLHTTTTVQQTPSTPVRSQAQPSFSSPTHFNVQQGSPVVARGSTSASAVASTSASTVDSPSISETLLDDEQSVFWVIISGKEPGVYAD